MWDAAPSPVEARERGLRRLRTWTTTTAVLAAVLAFVFALLAAGTLPGRDTAAAGSSGSGAQPSDDQTRQPAFGDDGVARPQPPGGGYFGSGSGGGVRGARSGGS